MHVYEMPGIHVVYSVQKVSETLKYAYSVHRVYEPEIQVYHCRYTTWSAFPSCPRVPFDEILSKAVTLGHGFF